MDSVDDLGLVIWTESKGQSAQKSKTRPDGPTLIQPASGPTSWGSRPMPKSPNSLSKYLTFHFISVLMSPRAMVINGTMGDGKI